MAATGSGFEGSAGEVPKAEEVKKRPLQSEIKTGNENPVAKKMKVPEEAGASSPRSGWCHDKNRGQSTQLQAAVK